jgi:hypothetical protein
MVVLVRIVLAFFVIGGFARAEAASYENARGAAYQCRLPVKAADLLDYAENPEDMLKNTPNGGDKLTWRIRTVATAGPQGLKIVGRVFRLANTGQKESIGEGLARAASTCESLNSEVTTHIADVLRASGDREIIRAFTKFLSNGPGDAADPAPPGVEFDEARARLPREGDIEGAGAYFGSRIDTGAVRLGVK